MAGTSAEQDTVTAPGGALNTGTCVSITVINCITFVTFKQASVILYVLVMISGHEPLSDTSDK